MVWGGDGVISVVRKSIGATKPLESDLGTIHCDLAVNIGRNVIHGSDVSEQQGLKLLFGLLLQIRLAS